MTVGRTAGSLSRKKRILIGTGVAALLLVAAVVVGVMAFKAAARNKQQAGTSRGGANFSNLQELPPPGSPEARQLAGNADTAGYIRDLYTYFEDNAIITEEMTESFLRHLQDQLAANPQLLSSNSNSSTNSTADLQPFIDVAADILNYFRHSDSQALLQLLRQYSASNGTQQVMLTDVAPDVLQAEVNKLLTVPTMDQYYRKVSHKGCDHARKSSTKITTEAAVKQQQQLGPQTPQEMLCSARSYSPNGLAGMSLPASAATISCPAEEAGVLAPFGDVLLPVVFHVFRFWQGDKILPPVWDAEQAGKDLIDATNQFYKGTGIQLKLQEVRYNPSQYSYLIFSSKADWQICAASKHYLSQACLVETAEMPEVAELVRDNVINVFVGGSSTQFCDVQTDEVSMCKSIVMGLSKPDGGWFEEPPVVKPNWQENDPAQNWMWVAYDELFGAKPWQGGAATVAHELGHYLGLMHTFQWQQEDNKCDEFGDGVLDTPAGQNFHHFEPADNPFLYYDLEWFCVQFRKGNEPKTDVVLASDSCPGKQGVDPVLNVMNYIPDACAMVFTPSQVQRMHRSMLMYRPCMVRQYQVK